MIYINITKFSIIKCTEELESTYNNEKKLLIIIKFLNC